MINYEKGNRMKRAEKDWQLSGDEDEVKSEKRLLWVLYRNTEHLKMSIHISRI